MSTLQKLFRQLQGHLNAEENELANEFAEALATLENEASETQRWVDCLEGAGVDNWSGCEYAQSAFYGEEEE